MSTTDEPDVTFVIAAYNAADTIGRAVRSALEQRGVSVEVVVADDCSSDGTRTVVAGLADARVRLLALEKNRGPGGARNAALDVARGRWVAVLDADDMLYPDRLARMIRHAATIEADMAVDNIDVLSGDGRLERMFPAAMLSNLDELALAAFIDSNVLFRGTHNFGYMKPVIRRAYLDRHALRFDEALRIGEDYLMLASALASGGRCAIVPEAGYVYHIREGSISRVLERHHVDAMIAGDQRFLARFDLAPEAAAAQRRRSRSLAEARAFLSLIHHIKNRSPAGALGAAIGDPLALRHLRMPIAARLRRLTAPLARPKAAAPAAAPAPSRTGKDPFTTKG